MAEDGYLTSKDTQTNLAIAIEFSSLSQSNVTLAPVVGRNLALEWGGNHEKNKKKTQEELNAKME